MELVNIWSVVMVVVDAKISIVFVTYDVDTNKVEIYAVPTSMRCALIVPVLRLKDDKYCGTIGAPLIEETNNCCVDSVPEMIVPLLMLSVEIYG